MGIIKMHNMDFFGYHGITAAEKQLAKRYSVDVEMEYNTERVAKFDKLDENVVNYELVYREISNFFLNNKFQLTETVAERLADLLFDNHKMANKLTIKVRKNHPPFPGFMEWVEVEVVRER
ncbi:dihydroneopterin aldolase [bacterium]|nr:dihydroneopterin aldolase [bacterium]